MVRRRFFVPPELIREGSATLPPRQAHHLRDVLRLRPGDVVEIFDGAGAGYTGYVELRGSEVVVLGLTSIPAIRPPFYLTIAAALIKPAKFEWVLEKCTELGIDEIIPLRTRFCDARVFGDRIESRLERWNRILTEASRQSERFSAPRLQAPQDFSAFLQGDFSGCDKIFFHEKSPDLWQPSRTASEKIIFCVGPEGGWESEEVEAARKAGFQVAGLGSLVLRAETAAVAAAAIVRHHIQLQFNSEPRRI